MNKTGWRKSFFGDRIGHFVKHDGGPFVKTACGKLLNARFLQYSLNSEYCKACASSRKH